MQFSKEKVALTCVLIYPLTESVVEDVLSPPYREKIR